MDMIMTLKPDSLQAGLNECFAADQGSQMDRWLAEGVGVVRLEKGFHHLSERFRQQPPIFIQHICPIQIRFAVTGKNEDLATIHDQAEKIVSQLVPSQTFSVQTRLLGSNKRKYKRFEVNQTVAAMLERRGWELNVAKPQQIVSIVLANETGYIGCSSAQQNLSDWAGGQHRFAQEEGQISRAEFKLLEALASFHVVIPAASLALDLGAAPGGWTRVLRQRGCQVYAVDPAALDQSLLADKQVLHLRETAQEFLQRKQDLLFDVIVNDMKMNVKESVTLMGKVHRQLKPGGVAIMTLKLEKKQLQKVTRQALTRLQQWYQIRGARQLFHNRSEVTVVLEKKG